MSAITDANGVATFKVKSANAGVSLIIGSAAGFTISQTATLQFSSAVQPPEAVVQLSVGDLVKSSDSSAVYYFGADNKRHAFSSGTIYFSYYPDFSPVKTISTAQMAGMDIGKNVKIRPGTWLIKITTDPKVYAVSDGGILRWISSESIANALYGANWNTKIIDIDAGFFGDYTIGTPVTTNVHPNGVIMNYDGASTVYYISNGLKRQIADSAAFSANWFQNKFKQVIAPAVVYPNGSDITGNEASLTQVYY
jgi:hypothetical protein